MKQRLAKAISVISVVPIAAFFAVTWIYLSQPWLFAGTGWYLAILFFLTLLPLSAYFLEYLIPSVRRQGREGERKLAFITGVSGYLLGMAVALVFHAPPLVKLIFLCYFIAGVLLGLTNGLIKYKASGHTCGIAGPLVFLIYLVGRLAWLVALLLPLVCWARLTMKRHSWRELLSGALIGICSSLIAIGIYLVMIR